MAIFPKGSLLQAGDVATPTNFATIPGLLNIEPTGQIAEILDETNHDTPSGFRDKKQGLKDWGSINAEGYWDPTNALYIQIFADYKSGVERYYRLVVREQGVTKATFEFKGFPASGVLGRVPFDALSTIPLSFVIKGDPEPTLT
jgi:hypothetical protein